MKLNKVIFLKLGGSLITDKDKPQTARIDVIKRISDEIAKAFQRNNDFHLVIGHGSGSFGHATADQFQTQLGGKGQAYWLGFAEVWRAARELNQIMIDHLFKAGLPVMAFPPSAGLISEDKHFTSWDTNPIKIALSHNLIPVLQGDVIFDLEIGGTIFSTEQIFLHLTKFIHPHKILLAGIEEGVLKQSKKSLKIISHITPKNYSSLKSTLSGSQSTDVTGGMRAKVHLMLEAIQDYPELQVAIFSGLEPGNITQALCGEEFGTIITNTKQGKNV